MAPRPFLLIGGKDDRPESQQYINEAKKIYRLYGKEDLVGFIYHGLGHSPDMISMDLAYEWLEEIFCNCFKWHKR